MMRMWKVLGSIAVAALSMSAFAVSVAQANPKGEFTAGATPDEHTSTFVHGWQYGVEGNKFVFGTGGEEKSEVTCESITLTSVIPAGTELDLSLTPHYSHCEFNTSPATITVNECYYTFTQPTKLAKDEYTGAADLVCPEGKAMEIHQYMLGDPTEHETKICTIKILPGAWGGHIVYTNNKGAITEAPKLVEKDDLTLKLTLSGFHYEEVSEGCPGPSPEHTTEDSELQGTLTLTGQGALQEHHDIWLSDEGSFLRGRWGLFGRL